MSVVEQTGCQWCQPYGPSQRASHLDPFISRTLRETDQGPMWRFQPWGLQDGRADEYGRRIVRSRTRSEAERRPESQILFQKRQSCLDAKEGEAPAAPKKKKIVKKNEVPIVTGTSSLDISVLNNYRELEASMHAADKLVKDTEVSVIRCSRLGCYSDT